MKRVQTRYIFLAVVVPVLLVMSGCRSVAIAESESAARSPDCPAPEVHDELKLVVENLKLSGDQFHPCYDPPEEGPQTHEAICLQPDWSVEWTCSGCALGQGLGLDFMVGLKPVLEELSEEECGPLRASCEEQFPGHFVPADDQPRFANETPFAQVLVGAPRTSFEDFEVSEVPDDPTIQVGGGLLIPRISGDGFLRAGPLKEDLGVHCYKVSYFLYDAETGEQLDMVDPHIVGGI